MRHRLLPFALCLGGCSLLQADFSYTQTTRITGGSMMNMMRMAGPTMREPQTSTTLIQGNRMAHVRKDTTEIIDLDQQTITSVNYARKTYSVMTFEQMRQRMESATRRTSGQDAQMNVKMSVDETGAVRQIQGYDTKEVVMKIEIDVTDPKSGNTVPMHTKISSWMANGIAGYDEVKQFHRKMAEKMGYTSTDAGMMGMGRPEVSKAMLESAKKMAQMGGVPLLQVTSMSGAGMPGLAQPSGDGQQPRPSVGDAVAGGALGRLGGLAGLGRRKKDDSKSQPQTQQQAPPATEGGEAVLMESTTEFSDFASGPVDSSKFAVPTGFQQVEAEMNRHMPRR